MNKTEIKRNFKWTPKQCRLNPGTEKLSQEGCYRQMEDYGNTEDKMILVEERLV